MKPALAVRAFEFRYRIFVSLGIVWLACVAAYALPVDQRTLAQLVFGTEWLGRGFIAAATLCGSATILRMSAGTVLNSGRVMSFEVRPEALAVDPPYSLVRNPIYLSDLTAAAGFSLCMPWPGLLYPLLLTVHYRELIRWEESQLRRVHGPSYDDFRSITPRLLPTPASAWRFMADLPRLRINADGARFNAVYLLFVPGLMVSAWTGSFAYAAWIGLPGVADWAYWHTRKGLRSPERSEVTS